MSHQPQPQPQHATIAELLASCTQSGRYERWLRQRLAQQVQRSAHLQHQLLAERERNAKLRTALRLHGTASGIGAGVHDDDDDSDASSTAAQAAARTDSAYRCAYDAAATCSSALAQYRHDELRHAHQRCLRRLHRQERGRRAAERERCLLADQFDELLAKYRLAHERLEFVCSRYLELYGRKAQAELQRQHNRDDVRTPSRLT